MVQPYEAGPATTPGRFVARVVTSVPRFTIPAMVSAIVWQVGESAVPVVTGAAIDRALATGDAGQLVLWIGVLVALYLALTVAARLTNRLNVHAVQLLQHRLRDAVHRSAPPSRWRWSCARGEMVSTMTNDVGRSNGVLLATMTISRIAPIVFIAISLLALYWPLGVVVLVGTPVVVWSMGRLSEPLSSDIPGAAGGDGGRATDLIGLTRSRGSARKPRRLAAISGQRETVAAERNAGLLGRFQVVSGVATGVFVGGDGLGWLVRWWMGGSASGLIATVGLTQALLPQIQAIVNLSIPNLARSRSAVDPRRARAAWERPPAGGPAWPARPAYGGGAADAGALPDGAVRRVSGARLWVAGRVGACAPMTAPPLVSLTCCSIRTLRTAPMTSWCCWTDTVPAVHAGEYRSRVVVAPHRATLFTGTIRLT